MTNFDFHPTSNFGRFFAVMDLKSKHFYYTNLYKYPFEFTVGFRTNYFMFFITYFLAIMAIHVDNFGNFFINFSFFYRASAILQIQKTNFMFGIFADSKRVYKVQIYKNHTVFNSFVFSYCNRLVCLFYTQIDIIVGFHCWDTCLFYFHASQVFRVSEKLTIKHFILFGITIWLPLLLLLVPYLYIDP
jgi:hypothetical protein